MPIETNREAVGVFQNEASLQSAADELLIAGFDRADLSLLASARTIEESLGRAYKRIVEIEDDPAVPKRAYAGSDSRTEAEGAIAGGLIYVGAVGTVGAVVASGGSVAAALAGAALAGCAAGIIGVMLARCIERRHAHELQVHLDRGGLALWVRTADEEHESRACEILLRAGAQDVHIHSLGGANSEEAPNAFPGFAFLSNAGASSPANDTVRRTSRAAN